MLTVYYHCIALKTTLLPLTFRIKLYNYYIFMVLLISSVPSLVSVYTVLGLPGKA